MSEITKINLGRWSLERVQFVLDHLGDFIDDEEKELRERARNFAPQTGLDKIESLGAGDPLDPKVPVRLLESLSAFFDSALLLQRGQNDDGNWWVTDLAWRGNLFKLELKDQVRATDLVPEITPMQVHRAPAAKLLERLNLKFLAPAPDADSFILKPTPLVTYVLISNIGAPWMAEHVAQAHRLIGKSFLY